MECRRLSELNADRLVELFAGLAIGTDLRFPQIRLRAAQSLLRARGEETVRLLEALRRQVVDQDRRVRFRTVEHEGIVAADRERRVDARPDPLRRRLFVSRSAVDLAGQKESGNVARFERR